MSDRPNKCLQIVINVDARGSETPAPPRGGRSKVHLNINLKVRPQADIYDPEFQLSDPEGGTFVSKEPHGRDQKIDLTTFPIKPIVYFHFHLKQSKGLRFLADTEQVIGINKVPEGSLDANCPRETGIASDQFEITNVSSKGRHMTLVDRNDDGGSYRFALFVYRRDTLVAVCDPRIINK